jgi:hypothetical protein
MFESLGGDAATAAIDKAVNDALVSGKTKRLSVGEIGYEYPRSR